MLEDIKKKATHLLRGQHAEDKAYLYLIDKGLKLVLRNFRCKQGELDLIMYDHLTLVIIEVRFRNTNKYGSASESVTKTKQQRIITATQVFLSGAKLDCPIRFDVIAISGDNSLEWIKNAFY